jgi:predicted nucleotidyltransferase
VRARQSADTTQFIVRRRRNDPPQSGWRLAFRGTGWRAEWAQQGEPHVDEAETPLDAERILRALAEHEVDYVLIGGLAVQTHGHVRTTNDADLIPAPDPSNLERLAAALRALDARVLNPGEGDTEIDAKMLSRATIWQFTSRDGGIDVMHEVPGGRSYAELQEGVLRVRLGDIEVPVVGLDDLIQMKLARGRPVDLADVASLTDPDVESRSE